MNERPEAAYVHVPFCRHRCGYCNFTVIANRLDLESDYLRALEIELSWLEQPQPVRTVFVGGGTPTELSPRGLQQLCRLLDTWFPQTERQETTFEANPDSLDGATADILAESGVTRLSLGIQSFDSQKLKALDRSHSVEDSRRAIRLARSTFESLSFDLIFGAPEETNATWMADLDTAIGLHPDHVSTYGMTIEAGTMFWNERHHGRLEEVGEDQQHDFYVGALDRLKSAGFDHYEVSSFARKGHKCRHNETYWLGQPYFAVGPGASRYVEGRRETNHRSTTTYLRRVLSGQSPVAESEEISREDRAREILVFGLRRMVGIDLTSFADQTDFQLEELVGNRVDRHIEDGFLEVVDGHLRLTRAGLLVSDSILPTFL